MNASISRQLIFWLAIPLLIIALCASLVHYFNSVAPGVLSSDKRLREASNALMSHLMISGGRIALDATPEGARGLPYPEAIQFAVRDSSGRLLAGNSQVPSPPMNPEVSQLFAMAPIDHRNLRTLTTRFDTASGMVFITAADVRPPGGGGARYGLMSTLLWDFVQLDLTLILVWVGIQIGLRPLKRLRREIAARSPQDLRAIDDAGVPRELAPVVATLNRLFGTLDSSAQSQRQFIANTAHQLRTPITGLQAQLDLLVSEPAVAPVRNRLVILQEGIRQLSHAANQLLTLARADPSVNFNTKRQPVDLGTIVNEVVAKFFDRALQSHIDLGADSHAAIVLADASLLDDLLSNLVDNALKYTPANGSVTVHAGCTDGKAFLCVDDTGTGIPATEREHVRQRFFRLPGSRGHGSGLGLSIVSDVARLFDGVMLIDTGSSGSGTKVTIEFPKLTAPSN